MGTIQNHSRDWVKVKFTFQVPADTDLEMVRKLVKKVGVQLQEDPELEGKFLEPLKSQGAVDIQGHAYVIGCKYTTKPGQQFAIRRRAFAALQQALKDKGVDLHAPRIMFDATHDAEGLATAVAASAKTGGKDGGAKDAGAKETGPSESGGGGGEPAPAG